MANSETGSLQALSNAAASSRVLNLSHVSSLFRSDADYCARPFFWDRNLNRSIILKHQLRSDEVYLVPNSQGIATKIIFPFDATLLKSGGRSILVGQNGYRETMAEFLGPSSKQTQRDLSLLALIETLPSLDPFLLKEHLARNNYFPADCYFNISTADMARMHAFARVEIGELIALALGKVSASDGSDAIGKLVDAMMSQDSGERLEPLRVTLGLDGQAFHDGVFSWKGFLYYKWLFGETAKKLNRIISEIELVRLEDRPSQGEIERLDAQRKRLRKSIREAARACTAVLTLYDDAFRDLVDNGKAAAFRKFLLEAPKLFLSLGIKIGVIEHILSFWSFRFPEEAPLLLNSLELGGVFAEFQNSLTSSAETEKAW